MAWLSAKSAASYHLISDDSYRQALATEWVPTLLIDGKPAAFRKITANLRTRERVEEWRGLTKAAAFKITGDSATQGNANGGTFQFEEHSIRISRRLANPAGGWIVTRTEKWAALYVDGAWSAGTSEAIFTNIIPPTAY